jgi:hypothetical protein
MTYDLRIKGATRNRFADGYREPPRLTWGFLKP